MLNQLPPSLAPGIAVIESNVVAMGQPLLATDVGQPPSLTLIMHPLDANALRYPNPFDRLRALERWVDRELRRRIH